VSDETPDGPDALVPVTQSVDGALGVTTMAVSTAVALDGRRPVVTEFYQPSVSPPPIAEESAHALAPRAFVAGAWERAPRHPDDTTAFRFELIRAWHDGSVPDPIVWMTSGALRAPDSAQWNGTQKAHLFATPGSVLVYTQRQEGERAPLVCVRYVVSPDVAIPLQVAQARDVLACVPVDPDPAINRQLARTLETLDRVLAESVGDDAAGVVAGRIPQVDALLAITPTTQLALHRTSSVDAPATRVRAAEPETTSPVTLVADDASAATPAAPPRHLTLS
jgi:hypothetical protein